MNATTSVPTISFTANGFVAPSETDILAGVAADWNAALGGNLNPSLKTPQGQLVTSETAVIGDSNGQQVTLFNSVDPAYAFGRMQDAIARIYFLTRYPAQSTVLQVACVGLVEVPIPVGAIVADPSDNLYLCTGTGTIPSAGTITLSFAAAVPGPLAVPASVRIYQSVPGWNTATLVSGVVGGAVESRAAFEARRAASVAANGAGFNPAVLGAILGLAGVIDAYVIDNPLGTTAIVGGVTLNANSLYVCVAGGAAQDIAQTIWVKKNPGCGYTGNTTETVYDSNSGYSPPYPSYPVTFQIPTGEPVAYTVSLLSNAGIPSNAGTLIGAAIQAAFLGEDDLGPRARIGSTIIAGRYYAGIAALGSWAQILSIQLGTDAAPSASFTGSISDTTLTVSAIADATFIGTASGVDLTASSVTGTILVGSVVSGTGVPAGTTIVSQTSGAIGGAGVYVTSAVTTASAASLTATGFLETGQFVYGASVLSGTIITGQLSGTTGSTGTYSVAVNQTVSSEAMTAVNADNNQVTMQIDQVPTFSPLDVNVVIVNPAAPV